MKTWMMSVVVAMVLIGCSGDKKENQAVNVEPVKKVTPASVVEKKPEPVIAKEEPKPVVEKAVQEVEKKVEAVVESVGPDGALLFKVCATCHGAKAEKKALGQSQIIKGWDEAKLYEALMGYKQGTYGGMMKMTMIPQIQKLSEEQIQALAVYISKL